MYENQSAVDCLRRALKNLRELLNTVNDKYTNSVKNDQYIREDDMDVKAVIVETLRQRDFGAAEDGAMDLK